MFYRTVLFCLLLLSIGFAVACNQDEAKTAVSSSLPTSSPVPTSTILLTAIATETKTAVPPLDTANNQPTQTPIQQTQTPATLIIEPSSSPTSVYDPDTVFSTSLSMSEQCTATNNTYYLRYRDNRDTSYTSDVFLSPDGNYKVEYVDDDIWLGPREGTLTQLPFSVTDIGLISNGVRWSPDSRYVILGSVYGDFPIWLASADGNELTLLSSEEYPNRFAEWSPDGQYLATLSYETWSSENKRSQVVIHSPGRNTPPLIIADDTFIDSLTSIGWSSDSLYFAWVASMEDHTEALHIWSAREKRQIFQTEVSYLRYASWSPQGDWLQGSHLHDLAHEQILLRADGSAFFRIPIANSIFYPPIWSPDGQAFATLDENTNQVKLFVMNIDGQVFEDVFVDDRSFGWRETSDIWSMSQWRQDGRVFLYIKHQAEDDAFQLMLYDSEIGVARPLLPGGVSLEPPVFMADYSHVFLVHKIGSDAWIKMVAIDGSSEKILADDALSAEHLTLFDDERYLAYVVWRNQGWQIELVDIETGHRQLLQDNLKQVLRMEVDEERDTIIIWWIGQDDTKGVSSYFSDGRLFYESNITPSHWPISAEFWSPNGETALLKLNVNGRSSNEGLVLAYPDNSEWIVVRNGLSGLGDPYWSPDSQMFAFTQLVTPLVSKGIDLEIVDLAGNTLWSYAPFSLETPNYYGGLNTLEWVTCP